MSARFAAISLLVATLSCRPGGAKVFDLVVAKDGSGTFKTIAEAIKAVPDNGSVRTRIFVKKGVYSEQIVLGATKKMVSLIGENPDSVVIRFNRHSGTNADGTVVSGYQGTTVFMVQGTDFYAENITFHNSAGNKGVALAISAEADRMITRNCRFLGYQDTYRSHKYRQYHADCVVEGGVDFIYADGQVVFDRCTIRTVSPGSVIAAPGEARQKKVVAGSEVLLGFLFNECKLVAGAGISAKRVNLGRMWGPQYPVAVFSKCALGPEITDEGWATMSSGAEKTSFVGEYRSVRSDGSTVDVSKRISWSRQVTEEQYKRVFNADSFFVGTTGSWGSANWFPRKSVVILPRPGNLALQGKNLQWQQVSNAVGYVVFRNGGAIGMVESATQAITAASGDRISVRAVGANGGLGDSATLVVGATSVGERPSQIALDSPPSFEGGSLRFAVPIDHRFVVHVLDATGRRVARGEGRGEQLVPIGSLPSGLYVIQVRQGKVSVSSHRIVRP